MRLPLSLAKTSPPTALRASISKHCGRQSWSVCLCVRLQRPPANEPRQMLTTGCPPRAPLTGPLGAGVAARCTQLALYCAHSPPPARERARPPGQCRARRSRRLLGRDREPDLAPRPEQIQSRSYLAPDISSSYCQPASQAAGLPPLRRRPSQLHGLHFVCSCVSRPASSTARLLAGSAKACCCCCSWMPDWHSNQPSSAGSGCWRQRQRRPRRRIIRTHTHTQRLTLWMGCVLSPAAIASHNR